MRAIFLITGGSVIILVVAMYTYYIFFVSKVGPIGNGTIATPIYIVIISSFISGICSLIQGILVLKNQSPS